MGDEAVKTPAQVADEANAGEAVHTLTTGEMPSPQPVDMMKVQRDAMDREERKVVALESIAESLKTDIELRRNG